MTRKKKTYIDQPQIVNTQDVHLDDEYAKWLIELKQRYKYAKIRATLKCNAEKLLFNWQLGAELVQKKAEERWGAGIVDQLSLDLQREFPEGEGFAKSNLWYMKKWYLFYTENVSSEMLQHFINELQPPRNKESVIMYQIGGDFSKKKLEESGSEFPLPFALIPWGQHIEIITRCKSIDEAFFYLKKVIEQGLSRPALVNCIKADMYAAQGKAVNNFSDILPPLQSKMMQEMFKENYDFSFATVDRKEYDERDLENALNQNITDMLLEMGTGFAFIGRQKEVIVGGRSRKIDLLFYHIRLRCYIVCELKVKAFEPEYVGKLNFYVSAVDELLKTDDDNPTIGLLVCSSMNKTDVKWSFRGVTTPMGVATYNNIKIQDMLPSQEQLQQRMELFTKEFCNNQKNNKNK